VRASARLLALLALLLASCGDGQREVAPPPADPAGEPAVDAAADAGSAPAEAGAESPEQPAAPTPGDQALPTAGADPPMLPPRPADQEEALDELEPWKRLDGPPAFEAVIPWQEAHQHLGKRMAVEGRIVRSYNSGRACFLNFAEDWKGKFHGVIFASSFPEYAGPPEQLFLDKRIRLIGKISEHQGAPQIVIEEPRQILVLDD